jgi:uncharacterized membrane protein YhhN
MNTLIAVAVVLAGVAAAVDWAAIARRDLRLERRAKPAVIVPLLVAVLLSDPNASPTSLLLAAALAASLVGDMLLLPPERFTYGLVAFLGAHVAYLGVFLLGQLDLGLAGLGALIAVAVLATVGRRILAAARLAGMGRPVGAYLVAICLMAIAATASGSVTAAVGAWIFVVSDALLGWGRFVAGPSKSPSGATPRRLAIMVTYHLAQILLTATILVRHAS